MSDTSVEDAVKAAHKDGQEWGVRIHLPYRDGAVNAGVQFADGKMLRCRYSHKQGYAIGQEEQGDPADLASALRRIADATCPDRQREALEIAAELGLASISMFSERQFDSAAAIIIDCLIDQSGVDIGYVLDAIRRDEKCPYSEDMLTALRRAREFFEQRQEEVSSE